MLAGKTNVVALVVGASTLASILLLQALPARPGHPDRRRGAPPLVVGCVRPRGARRRVGARPAAAGTADARRCRSSASTTSRRCSSAARGGARVVRRHERALARLCRADAHAGRSEPGDGRPRRRQPRGRLLPGLSDQQQLVAHAGGRGRRRAHAADRRRRRAGHRAAAGRWRPNLLQDLPSTALAAVVIAAAIGLIEVADLRRIYRIQRWEFWLSMVCFAGVAVFGAIPGIGDRDRDRRDRVPLGRLAPAFGGARTRRARQGLPRHHPLSAGAPHPGPRAVPLGRAAVLRQRGALPRPRARRGGEFADARALGRGGGRAGDQRRRHRRRHRGGARRQLCTPRASSCASPR